MKSAAVAALLVIAFTSGCAGSSSRVATATTAPDASSLPVPSQTDSSAGSPELVAGADFTSPEAAGYTVMKALDQLPITRAALLPYLDTATNSSESVMSDLKDLDASIAMSKVKKLTALHVLVADPHTSSRTATYGEVEYSFNGTWCYTNGHCKAGNTKPYLKFYLAGGQWKMIINDVAILLEGPS